MRKIVSGMFITLDGVIENPHAWNPPYYNQEMTDAVRAQSDASDLHLYGSQSCRMFRSVFTPPAAERIPHARLMNEMPKALVSTTIKDPSSGPTTVIAGDIGDEIRRLKEQPGKDIQVQASGTLVSFLLQEGLLDELNLLIHPIVVGSRRRLFADGASPVPLTPAHSKQFTNGVVSLSLVPNGACGSSAVGSDG